MTRRFLCHICFLAILLWILSSCESGQSVDPNPPSLSVVPVAIDQTVAIIPFGQNLTTSQKSPAFEYILSNEEAEVVACTKGVVTKVLINQGIADWELHIQPQQNSEWLVIYDHVLEVTVVEGETIEAGDILGKVGVGNRTELQINKGKGTATEAYCPLDYGTENFVNLHYDYFDIWCITPTVAP